jgi:tetratricopeptide (TPR) repeat protein
MIVKNESKIILRLLESVLPIIDSYCICDTGSTDSTTDIIQLFFDKHSLPGKIVREPFRDFGYNRTFALRQCNDMENADYILLLDADMVLKTHDINIAEFKENLLADAYHIFQGSNTFFYKNVRLVRNDPRVAYWGVTHEYVQTPPGFKYEDISMDKLFINDIGDGGAKSEKFERDVRLLTKGLEELPNNDRYTFYLANSYRDLGQHQNAIDTYKKRIEIGGWREEIWFSYYSIGKCYRDMGDFAQAQYYWLEGYNYFPDRVENLYELITHYRQHGKNNLAYTFYDMAQYERKRCPSTDHLFLEKDVYDYKLDYEFSIIGYYCNRNSHDIDNACMRVLANGSADEGTQKNVLSNYKFYATKLRDLSGYSSFSLDIGNSNIIDKTDMISSTPSVCIDKSSGELVVNVRFINYRIGEHGEYINKDRIVTKNVVATFTNRSGQMIKTSEYELKYEASYDNLYVGLEDVRLHTANNGDILFNSNRGLSYECMVIEHGKLNLKSHQTVSTLVKKEGQRAIEKNWVIFQDYGDNHVKMVYEWHPLTIGSHRDHPEHLIDGENRPITQLDCTTYIDTPPFFRWLRGSTNGLSLLNPADGSRELWFICHLVSYEDRRYYYHIFVVLDAVTYAVKRYSRLFTFEGEKVEYTLGFVYFDEKKEFMIGYSLLDRETKYMKVGLEEIERLME